jgi:hypothetical protein
MPTPKQLVTPIDDNWADYFSFILPTRLVKGLTIGPDGIDRDGPKVDQLLAWDAEQSEKYLSKRFQTDRHDAATVLELAAGWAPDRKGT